VSLFRLVLPQLHLNPHLRLCRHPSPHQCRHRRVAPRATLRRPLRHPPSQAPQLLLVIQKPVHQVALLQRLAVRASTPSVSQRATFSTSSTLSAFSTGSQTHQQRANAKRDSEPSKERHSYILRHGQPMADTQQYAVYHSIAVGVCEPLVKSGSYSEWNDDVYFDFSCNVVAGFYAEYHNQPITYT